MFCKGRSMLIYNIMHSTASIKTGKLPSHCKTLTCWHLYYKKCESPQAHMALCSFHHSSLIQNKSKNVSTTASKTRDEIW